MHAGTFVFVYLLEFNIKNKSLINVQFWMQCLTLAMLNHSPGKNIVVAIIVQIVLREFNFEQFIWSM